MDATKLISNGLARSAAAACRVQAPSWARILGVALAALVLGSAGSILGPASARAASGDITTVAGNGFDGYSGDGGPATSALPEGAGRSRLHRRRPVHRGLLHPHGSQGELGRHDQHAGGHRHGGVLRRRRRGHFGAPQRAGRRRRGRRRQPLHRRLRELARPSGQPARHDQHLRRHGDLRLHRRRRRGDGGAAWQPRRPGSRLGRQPVCDRLRHPHRAPDHPGRDHQHGRRQRLRRLLGGRRSSPAARLNQAGDVAVDGAGNLFIGEFSGHRVRKVSAAGTISTVGGTGSAGYSGNGGPATSAQMSSPAGVDVDSLGNVFVAEFGNHVIRKIDTSGTITRVAGTGFAGFSGDGAPAVSAQLQTPSRVTLSPAGDFYISDWGNHRVRHVDKLGSPDAPTLSSTSPASPSSSNTTQVIGSAPSGSTVRLYTDSACTSAVAANGTAARLASPGLTVTVADDSTTTFWAITRDGGSNPSGCSTSSITYVEDSTPPSAPTIDSAPSSPGNDVTPDVGILRRGRRKLRVPPRARRDRGLRLGGLLGSAHLRPLVAGGRHLHLLGARPPTPRATPAPPRRPATTSTRRLPRRRRSTRRRRRRATTSRRAGRFSGEAGATLECRLERGATVVSDWAACTSPQTYDLSARARRHLHLLGRAPPTRPATPARPRARTTCSTAPRPRRPPSARRLVARQRHHADLVLLGRGRRRLRVPPRARRDRRLRLGRLLGPEDLRPAAEPDGSYDFSVRATDAAGNTGARRELALRARHERTRRALDRLARRPSPGNDATPAWSLLRRGGSERSNAASSAARRSSPTGRPARVRRPTTSRASPTAATPSRRAHATLPATPARPRAPPTNSTAPRPRRPRSISASSPGNDPSPSWTFSGEAGASVRVPPRARRDGRLRLGLLLEPAARTTSPSEPDGSYTFSVRARDAAGNTGPAASSAYELDTSAPGAAVDRLIAAVAAATTPHPSWSFSGEAGRAFECRLARGATVVSDWAACSDPKGYDLSAEPDGVYDFSVRARDAAGNTGAATTSLLRARHGRAGRALDRLGAALARQRPDSLVVLLRRGRRDVRVPPRARRDGGRRTGRPAPAPTAFDLAGGARRQLHRSASAARDAAGNTGSGRTSAYDLDTRGTGRAGDRPAAALAGQRPQPRPGPSPARPGATFECRLERGATVVSDWAACSSPRELRPDARARRRPTPSRCARATPPATPARPPARTTCSTRTLRPRRRSTPRPLPGQRQLAGLVVLGRGGRLVRVPPGARRHGRLRLGRLLRPEDLRPRPREPDGSYDFSVRGTRRRREHRRRRQARPTSSTRARPAAPSIDSRPGSPGNDATPTWAFSGEAGRDVRVPPRARRHGGLRLGRLLRPEDLRPLRRARRQLHLLGARQRRGRQHRPRGQLGLRRSTRPRRPRPSIDSAPASPGNDTTPAGPSPARPAPPSSAASTAAPRSSPTGPPAPTRRPTTSPPSPTAPTPSRSGRPTPPATPAPPRAPAYTLDTQRPAAPAIDTSPASPGNDATPGVGLLRRGRGERSSAVSSAAPRSSPTGPPAPTRRPTTSPREPDGSYTFSVRARDAAGNTGPGCELHLRRSTARAPGAPSIDSSPPSPGTDATPGVGASPARPARRFECRLERGATVVSDWAACSDPKTYDLTSSPTATTTFARARQRRRRQHRRRRPARPTTSTRARRPHRRSTPRRRRRAMTRRPAWAFSAEAGATLRVPPRARRHGRLRLGRLLQPRGLRPLGRARRQLHLLGARHRCRREHRPGRQLRATSSTAPAPRLRRSARGRLPRAATPRRAGASRARPAPASSAVWCAGQQWSPTGPPAPIRRATTSPRAPTAVYGFSVRGTRRRRQHGRGRELELRARHDRAGCALDRLLTVLARQRRDACLGLLRRARGERSSAVCERGATVVSDWAACSSPEAYDLTAEPDGSYTFSVRARDAAGNSGVASTSSYELDTSAPGTPSIDSSPPSPSNDRTPGWGFSGEAGASLECRLVRGATVVSDWAACSSPQAYDLTSEPDGDYQFGVRARDAVGNASAAASSDYTLDASIPPTPSIDSTPGVVGNDASPAWGFSGDCGLELRVPHGARGHGGLRLGGVLEPQGLRPH